MPVLGKYKLGEPVLDNASIHHSDEIVQLIEAAGAKVIYTAPYSPDLNPIEYMFSKYKKMLKRYHNDEWSVCHMKALISVNDADAGAYFRHCGVPYCNRNRSSIGDPLEKKLLIHAAAFACAAGAAATFLKLKCNEN